MPDTENGFETTRLKELLDQEHEEMQNLLVKVINVCGGFQLEAITERQMKDRVRKEIENSVARKRLL